MCVCVKEMESKNERMLCGARTASIDTNLLMKIIIKLQQYVIVFSLSLSLLVDGYEIMGLKQKVYTMRLYIY